MEYGILMAGDKVKFTAEFKKNNALAFKAGCKTDDIKKVEWVGTNGMTCGLSDGTVYNVKHFRFLKWYERHIYFKNRVMKIEMDNNTKSVLKVLIICITIIVWLLI